MTTLWIVAANAATATLLECTSRQHITEIARLEHPESRLHSRDLESDIPTHGAADRSGLAQRSSAQEREQEHFAQQIASQLKQGLDDHRYGGVVIYASNPFLGELLAHLNDGVRRLVTAHHPHDLTGLSPQQLQARVLNEL